MQYRGSAQNKGTIKGNKEFEITPALEMLRRRYKTLKRQKTILL